jgi:hypothetical protein
MLHGPGLSMQFLSVHICTGGRVRTLTFTKHKSLECRRSQINVFDIGIQNNTAKLLKMAADLDRTFGCN